MKHIQLKQTLESLKHDIYWLKCADSINHDTIQNFVREKAQSKFSLIHTIKHSLGF